LTRHRADQHPGGKGFTVVPPGPVTDRTEVELRAAVAHPERRAGRFHVTFFRERIGAKGAGRQPIGPAQEVALPPGAAVLARAWWKTTGEAGDHRLLCRIEDLSPEAPGPPTERAWPLEVVPCDTPALPLLLGVWLDPLGLKPDVYAHDAAPGAADVRALIRALSRLNVRAVIVTYVEYMGGFFYPSDLSFYDRDVGRKAKGNPLGFDAVGAVLGEADRQGMHVFLGLGRGGDTPLLWEFDKPGWIKRCRTAVDISRRVADDLWDRYKGHPSLYGWYLTHEMADLGRSSAYYDPVADHCHGLAPDKPVLVAPAGTPSYDAAALRASHVDIFAYQDAVGAGYVPYRYTYDPENRLRALDEIYGHYSALHAASGKHLWADLELWEMDGSKGYGGAYPPPFGRVRRQIETEARHVGWVTGYECTGFLDPPGGRASLKDPRARRLFEEYADYARGVRRRR
jgi:hypothetical protein